MFDDCRVPGEALIGGEEGKGFRTVMKVLDKGRLHIAAVALGIARRALEEAITYAQARNNSGSP